MLTGVVASVGKAFAAASATEVVHAAASQHGSKKLPQPAPNPTVTSNPLTVELNRWKGVEFAASGTIRTGFVTLQQKAFIANKSKPPVAAVPKVNAAPAAADDTSDDDKSMVNVTLETAAADSKTAAAPDTNKKKVPAKEEGLWDRLKALKKQGFSILIDEALEASKTAMTGLRSELEANQQKLATITDPKTLKSIADRGEDITYQIVDLTNNLTVMFEAIQEDLMKGGVNLNTVLAMSEDRSERGIYKLMQRGIKDVNRFLNEVTAELAALLPQLSKRIDAVCNPAPASVPGLTMMSVQRTAPQRSATISPAPSLASLGGTDEAEITSDDEQSFSPRMPGRRNG